MRDRTAEQHMLDLYMLRQENQRLLDRVREQQSTLDLQEQELRRLEAEHSGITRASPGCAATKTAPCCSTMNRTDFALVTGRRTALS